MYLPLEINQQIADMIRSAADLYSQVNEYINCKECKVDEFPVNTLMDMSGKVNRIIIDLVDILGNDITEQVFNEERREKKV